MAISKREALKVRQPTKIGESAVTPLLDGSNTTETIVFSMVAEKITLQASGDLAGDFTVSADGVNFDTGGSLAASNALASFNTHNVRAVRVTRTGGSGKVTILGR